MMEAFFVAFSFHLILRKSTGVLLSPECRANYGSLYANLRSATKLPLFTVTLSNIRSSLLALLLVSASTRPALQSLLYLSSAIVCSVWNLRVRPYSDYMLTVQMTVLDLTKLAAGVGYIFLNIPALGEETANWIIGFVVTTLIVGVGTALSLAIAQIAKDAFKSGERTETFEKVSAVTTSPVDASLQSQNAGTVQHSELNSCETNK